MNPKQQLQKVVNDLLRKEARKEAMEILEKSEHEKVGEFLDFYYGGMENIACLTLDTAKDILVKKKKTMKQKKNDSFGMAIFFQRDIFNKEK